MASSNVFLFKTHSFSVIYMRVNIYFQYSIAANVGLWLSVWTVLTRRMVTGCLAPRTTAIVLIAGAAWTTILFVIARRTFVTDLYSWKMVANFGLKCFWKYLCGKSLASVLFGKNKIIWIKIFSLKCFSNYHSIAGLFKPAYTLEMLPGNPFLLDIDYTDDDPPIRKDDRLRKAISVSDSLMDTNGSFK